MVIDRSCLNHSDFVRIFNSEKFGYFENSCILETTCFYYVVIRYQNRFILFGKHRFLFLWKVCCRTLLGI